MPVLDSRQLVQIADRSCECCLLARPYSGSCFRLGPFPVLLDQVHQAVHGFRFGNVELHYGLSDVEVDLARRAADVAEIRIRHLARAIHDAAHDRNLHTLEMLRAGFNAAGDGLEVEEGAAA